MCNLDTSSPEAFKKRQRVLGARVQRRQRIQNTLKKNAASVPSKIRRDTGSRRANVWLSCYTERECRNDPRIFVSRRPGPEASATNGFKSYDGKLPRVRKQSQRGKISTLQHDWPGTDIDVHATDVFEQTRPRLRLVVVPIPTD